jgi:thioredoxin 1
MREINESEFNELTGNGTVVVEFGAEWCGPCKAIAPILQKLSTDLAGRLFIYSVDIDHSPALAARHGVMSVPTLLLMKNGKVVDRIVGMTSEGNLRKKLDPHLGAA